MKYVFITGGVTSSLGKGVMAASLGCLLKARGYRVSMQKLDLYYNAEPALMSPLEHGEAFITDDGHAADLDLGNYERFVDTTLPGAGSRHLPGGKAGTVPSPGDCGGGPVRPACGF